MRQATSKGRSHLSFLFLDAVFLPSAAADIKALFSSAAELLAEVCEDAAANDEVAPAGAAAAQQAQQAQQHEGAGAGVLGGVVNIEAAVGRGLEGVK